MKNMMLFLTLTLCGALVIPSQGAAVNVSAELSEFVRGNHLFSANVYKVRNIFLSNIKFEIYFNYNKLIKIQLRIFCQI